MNAKTQPGLKAEIYDFISIADLSDEDIYSARVYNQMGLALMTGNEPEVEMELDLTASIIYEMLL